MVINTPSTDIEYRGSGAPHDRHQDRQRKGDRCENQPSRAGRESTGRVDVRPEETRPSHGLRKAPETSDVPVRIVENDDLEPRSPKHRRDLGAEPVDTVDHRVGADTGMIGAKDDMCIVADSRAVALQFRDDLFGRTEYRVFF